jgi:glycosyltransferase involved in cell wall biosynthesis
LEAAALGRAVIASRVGGIPEYADRLGNAMLVEPNDLGGLAAAIEKLAGDGHLARQIGQAGHSAARFMNVNQHVDQLTIHYERVIRRS